MDDFERELKQGFLEEATQLLMEAEQCFFSLESNPNDADVLMKIFRIAHNLKGSAKAVGFNELGEFTHEFESFLIALKSGEISLTRPAFELLLRCNDHVTLMVNGLKADLSAVFDSRDLIDELKAALANKGVAEPDAPAEIEFEAAPPASAFVEPEAVAPTELPKALETLTAEVMSAAPAPGHPAQAAVEIVAAQAPEHKPAHAEGAPKQAVQVADESIRVSLQRLEKLLNYVGEMVILNTVLREQVNGENPLLLRKTVHQMGKVTKEVQDLSMSLRMVPLKTTFQKMQRIVRDTSVALGKKVHLVLEGEETEVDKTILESLGDPLVHLIRNACDHGIEDPASRAAKGKAEQGTIVLRAFHQGGSLVIEIRDDGAGMDAARLRAKAVEKGILKPGQEISDRDAYALIFSSGFSTKAVVTDVSGRGVGMDVVKTNIERLQGEIQIETVLGAGTVFRIRLPLTLAIIDGMILRVDKDRYVIPLSHVHESIRPTSDMVTFVSGLGEVLTIRGEHIPIYRLGDMLTQKGNALSADQGTAVVVRLDGRPFAILIDEIMGQHQIVIKQLGPEHRNLKGFSGSAVLGDGRPALILEANELIKKNRPRSAPLVEEKRKVAA